MVAATACLVLMTLFIKQARLKLTGPEVVFWRGLLSLPLLLVALRGSSLRVHNLRLFAVRVAFGFSAMTGYAIAVKGLSMVDIDLVSKLRPLVIAVVAPMVLGRGERPGRGVWSALAIGFAGCFILLAPDLTGGSPYAVWGVAAMLLSAGAHLCLRGLGATEQARVIVFWFHAAVAALSAATIVVTGGRLGLPPAGLWPLLLGTAVAATAGQVLMTRAYALDRAPVVAGATYTGIVWALLGDLLVFGVLPGLNAVAGGLLVLASSLWLVLGPSRRAAGTSPRETVHHDA
jgi:drug/metabolite transporter (DMT)-like permease